jgi:hypothetical protein
MDPIEWVVFVRVFVVAFLHAHAHVQDFDGSRRWWFRRGARGKSRATPRHGVAE